MITFAKPLKYIDVTRSTHTDLDVAQEKRIDDYWNIDENKRLSDSWRVFAKFILLKETPPKGFMWSGERLTKIQTTTRPDNVWPEAWTRIGKAVQKREKQEWALEKPKLDNARQWRGFFLLIRQTKNTKTSIENAKRKIETLVDAAMPCKKIQHPMRFQKQNMLTQWKITNVENVSYRKSRRPYRGQKTKFCNTF